MTGFSRRAYLSGTLAAVAGIGGVAAAQPDESERGGNGARQRGRDRHCPPGTTLLARYEPQRGDSDTELEHAAGDDAVTFDAVETAGGGRITGFDWRSSAPVATVEVAYGPNLDQFDGGFAGSVDRSGGGPRIDAVRFCAPRGGRAHVADVNLDLAFENEFHRARPGDQKESGDVLHVRTDSDEPTEDYALSTVNVLQRRGDDDQLRVDDLESLTFDYYKGPDDTGVVPDGVFVALLPETDDQQLQLGWDQAAEGSEGSWETFDVLEQMSSPEWRVEPVTFGELQTGDDVLGAAMRLRDDPERREVALADEFGDARLAGVAVGSGSTSEPAIVDRYYDSLVVETADGSDRYSFPATLEADVDVEADGPEVVTTLSLTGDAEGLSLEDVDEDAIALANFGPLAPPIDAVVRPEPDSVDVVDDGQLEVSFRRGPVQQLLDRQSRPEFLVAADLDVAAGSAVFGVGEWDR